MDNIVVIDNILAASQLANFEKLCKKLCLLEKKQRWSSSKLAKEIFYEDGENYDVGQYTYPVKNGDCLQEYIDDIINDSRVLSAVKDRYRSRTKVNYIEKPSVVSNKVRYHNPHVDTFTNDAVSCVFYISDVDSGTLIYNQTYPEIIEDIYDRLTLKKYVAPKQNRMVIFPSNHFHSAEYPKSKDRTILNIVFEKNNLAQS